MFKFIAAKLWGAVKTAASWVWHRALKPAARAIARWFGVAPTRTEAVLERVEENAKVVVAGLETDLGPLIATAMSQVDAMFKRWLRDTWGDIGHTVSLAIERIERHIGVAEAEAQAEEVVRVERVGAVKPEQNVVLPRSGA